MNFEEKILKLKVDNPLVRVQISNPRGYVCIEQSLETSWLGDYGVCRGLMEHVFPVGKRINDGFLRKAHLVIQHGDESEYEVKEGDITFHAWVRGPLTQTGALLDMIANMGGANFFDRVFKERGGMQ